MAWRSLPPVAVASSGPLSWLSAGLRSDVAQAPSTTGSKNASAPTSCCCWLALLLIRLAENQTGQTWPVMHRELDRIHLGTFTGPAGTFGQRTELTKPARDLLTKLGIDPPRRIHELTPGT